MRVAKTQNFGKRACSVLGAVVLLFLTGTAAWAHGIVGDRMFIEPLFTEDANVKNELVFPLMQFSVQPDGTWRTLDFSFEKQLYPERLSLTLEGGRIFRHDGIADLSGWDNLDLGLKFETYTSAPHELVISTALSATLPVGTRDITDRETALNPMLLYGKGFGDLSPGWLRPFAVQGDLGMNASVKGPYDRQFFYDVVLMYSLPYLNHLVRKADAKYSTEDGLRRGFSRGAILGNLFPYVEFNGVRSVKGPQEVWGSLRPGILWMGKYAQVSMAADIPVQYPVFQTRPHKGFCFSLDWFLDDIIPAIGWTPFGRH